MMRCNLRPFAIIILVAALFASCASPEKARYFNGVTEGQFNTNYNAPDPVIQKGDILSITVSSLNPEASKIFNAPITNVPSSNTVSSISEVTGYLVGPDGKITFPVLGDVTAEGLTKKQLTDHIKNDLLEKKLLVDPIVTIRIMNFRVTVLGEVGRPGVVNVPNEKISILEAVGFAGDMTLYAKRDNVLLIREENGKKITRRLNLNNDDIFRSPYFYLKSNDIVYVEANKSKVQSTARSNQLLPIIISGLAFVAIILDRVINE
ncbi:polysaccharide biosynthesis/export family protein [Flavihumibacter rivuli]|uniref:polysaccharide biosynthesis/export family protein n=1 Tax=Flavihumibacter rivuli TaxID=2838156 RepID=UPI001BDE299B|nr:polysaccharide biosynthesis/export family protein [Flavihumibacter rivuli]ULQ57954.1 polysaccharide biosynthesis/export family protein [Flavihumibacter rivuli]